MLLYLVIILIGIAIISIPQWYVSSTYKKYLKQPASSNLTGEEIARAILREHALNNQVSVQCVQGNLTDHFDPKSNAVRLSENNYYGYSISAISVAAHEVGHALQHNLGYSPIKFRSAFWPVASMGDKLGAALIFLGFIMMFMMGIFGLGQLIAIAGLLLYGTVVLFQFITLPVELDASARAIRLLQDNHFISGQEITLSKKVLNAAALTYIASALYAMLNLAYYAYILFGNRE